MKISIAAVCILAFATSLEVQSQNVIGVIRDCKSQNNCKENILQIIRGQAEPQTDECFCAIGCIGKARGFLSDTNGVDKETLKKILKKMQIPDDKAEMIAEKCKSASAANECDAAKKLAQCMKEQAN